MLDSPLLILDADGVFLDERPYWEAALATAFQVHGLREYAQERWSDLVAEAFERMGLQRLTKSRGCNSNWDLAAVMTRALENRSVTRRICRHLCDGCVPDTLNTIKLAVETLWHEGTHGRATGRAWDAECDPLLGFGMTRDARNYSEIRATYQKVLANQEKSNHGIPQRLRESQQATRRAFVECTTMGWQLRVCTGRRRPEVLAPLRTHGLVEMLPPDRIISATEVEDAERTTGRRPLGKPHWFPLASAVVGLDHGIALLHGAPLPPWQAPVIYCGDAPADFRTARACRSLGLPVGYVHLRSGMTTEDEDRVILNADVALGTITFLGELPALLGREMA